jgi:hypothetical protein
MAKGYTLVVVEGSLGQDPGRAEGPKINKTCVACGDELDDEQFYVKDPNTGRRDQMCKSCRRRQINARYTKKGPPKAREGWVDNGIGYIPLTQGQIATVDPEDVGRLSQYNWCAVWSPQTQSYYAFRNKFLEPDRHKVLEGMHRFVLGLGDDDERNVDHENHDTLYNRKTNLRPADDFQNTRNARIRKDNKTGFKGVTHRGKKYQAGIRVNGKRKHLGTCDTAEEARILYENAAKELHQEFACLG